MIIYGSYTGHFNRDPDVLLDADIFGSLEELNTLVENHGLTRIEIPEFSNRYVLYRKGAAKDWKFIDYEVVTDEFMNALIDCGGHEEGDFESEAATFASYRACCIIKQVVIDTLPNYRIKHQEDLEGVSLEPLSPNELAWAEVYRTHLLTVNGLS